MLNSILKQLMFCKMVCFTLDDQVKKIRDELVYFSHCLSLLEPDLYMYHKPRYLHSLVTVFVGCTNTLNHLKSKSTKFHVISCA